MKPQLIDCGSKCKVCDGYGIMTLYTGHEGKQLEAPCLNCSPTKNIYDLYEAKCRAISAFEKAKELKLIDEHNRRIAETL